MFRNSHLRGQGATEYLVLLAVVLIIALVSIALLGFFPGLASDAKITQSNSYWQGDARPFHVIEHAYSAGGTLSLILQNVEATGTYTLTAINISFTNTTGYSYTTATSFAPGETKNISIIGVLPVGTSGSLYELNVNLSYTSPNSLSGKFVGSKPIIGRYN